MKILKVFLTILIAIIFARCSSTYKLSQVTSESELNNIELNDFFTMVLYPESQIEARVALEKSISDHLNTLGLKSTSGYTYLPNYDKIEEQTEQIIGALKKSNSKNLLLFNPIHIIEYSDEAYYNEVAIYRAMGMESAEFWTNVGYLLESSEASKFIIGVSLWNLEQEKFVWQGTYDINAPGAYELEYAKLYSKEFIEVILEDIQKSILESN